MLICVNFSSAYQNEYKTFITLNVKSMREFPKIDLPGFIYFFMAPQHIYFGFWCLFNLTTGI